MNPLISINYRKASCFVNKKGEHPKTLTVIRWDKIIVNKEELTDNNWLFLNMSEKQLNTIKMYKDRVAIIEE